MKRKLLNKGDLILNGKYEIVKLIHNKGMSNVYLVMNRSLNVTRCLKEIKRPNAESEYRSKKDYRKAVQEYDSLISESSIMTKLNHPAIPRISDIFEEGGSVFILMDYIEGVSLRAMQEKRGPFSQKEVIYLGKEICKVMMYLHSKTPKKDPLFYRDLKPDNIMIQSIQDGNQVKILDFGISKFLKTDHEKIEQKLGTRGFAAPEMYDSEALCDLRSDIFSFGRVLISLLTGFPLSDIKKDEDIRKLDIAKLSPGVSRGLVAIIDKCCEVNPKDRYDDFSAVFYALNNYEKEDIEYLKKAKRKIKTVFALGIIGVMLVGMSFIPRYMSMVENNRLYEESISVAQKSERVEDWERAVSLKPEKLDAYLGLIEAIKTDGKFSKDEEEFLLNKLSPISTTLVGNKDYGKVAYEVGKLYWFYYPEDKSAGEVASVKWFKDAEASGYKVEQANTLHNIGEFKKKIVTAIAESSDDGMYIKFWNNLLKAKKNETGELVELQLNEEIINAIEGYGHRLKVDGVSKKDMIAEIGNVQSFIKNSNPSESLKKRYEELNKRADESRKIVDELFAKGGEK